MSLSVAALAIARAAGGPLLAIDTSTETAMLALAVDDVHAPLRERTLPARALPSEGLFEHLVALLDDAQLSARDIRAFIVGLGPGSFTGLRVGLASVKGMALGNNAAVYGISSLAWSAAGTPPGRIWVVRDARRQSLFTACFDVGPDYEVQPVGPEQCLPLDQAFAQLHADAAQRSPLRVTGDAAEWVAQQMGADTAQPVTAAVLPGAAFLACLARVRAQQADAVTTLQPRYLQQMPAPKSAPAKAPV